MPQVPDRTAEIRQEPRTELRLFSHAKQKHLYRTTAMVVLVQVLLLCRSGARQGAQQNFCVFGKLFAERSVDVIVQIAKLRYQEPNFTSGIFAQRRTGLLHPDCEPRRQFHPTDGIFIRETPAEFLQPLADGMGPLIRSAGDRLAEVDELIFGGDVGPPEREQGAHRRLGGVDLTAVRPEELR